MTESLAIVVGELKPYGGQKVALDLARELAKRLSVSIITFEPVSATTELPRGVAHVRLRRGGHGITGLLRLCWALRKTIRDNRYTYVLSVMTYANIATLLSSIISARPKPRVIISEHSVTSTSLFAGEKHPRIMLSLMRRLYPTSWALVGVADTVVDDLRSMRVQNMRMCRIYNPVPVPVSSPPRPPHPWLTGPGSANTLVCVGNLKEAKGFDIAICALPLLPVDFKLVIVGDGELLNALRALVMAKGVVERVEFVGWQDDPGAWMSHAALVLVPSRWEGFGLVAVEAHLCGAKVIASDVGGLSEVGRLIGATMVPPRDVAALANAVQSASLHPARASGEVPRRPAGFDPAYAADEYLALFRKG